MSAGDPNSLYANAYDLSANVTDKYTIETNDTTSDNTNNPWWGQTTLYTPGVWQAYGHTKIEDYKEVFTKLITHILGSSQVSQEIKDEFVNQCMRLEPFRTYVKEYFPQYEDKILLWEKLHINEK